VPPLNKQSRRRRRFLDLAALPLLLLLSANGCGPGDGKVEVTGTVAFDGNPMPDGYVTFTPEEGGAPAAGPILAGKFSLRATPGAHRVEIEASRFVGPKNPVMGLQPREQYVPARYNTETTLRGEVKADEPNEFEFNLSSQDEEQPTE
jgi:hypothetical protein